MSDTLFPAVILWVDIKRETFCLACCNGESYLARFRRKLYPTEFYTDVLESGWQPSAGEMVLMTLRYYRTSRGRDTYCVDSCRPIRATDNCSDTERADLAAVLDKHNRRQTEIQKARRQRAKGGDGFVMHGMTKVYNPDGQTDYSSSVTPID
jgi:hypothetical protein